MEDRELNDHRTKMVALFALSKTQVTASLAVTSSRLSPNVFTEMPLHQKEEICHRILEILKFSAIPVI